MQDLPEGFQRSEFLIGKGQIDTIVHRKKIPETLDMLMSYFLDKAGFKKKPKTAVIGSVETNAKKEDKKGKKGKKDDKKKKEKKKKKS